MQKVAEGIFLVAWILCGCTIDTIFSGGAPWFLAGAIAMAAAAVVLAGESN